MSKVVLVVGINGFVGKHLARELYEQSYTVYGSGIEPSPNAQIENIVDKYFQCDFTKPEDIAKLPLADISAVINLAGLAQVGDSFGKAELYRKINVEVHTNLMKKIFEEKLDTRVIAISTGAVYDNHQPMPLSEKSKLTTDSSPYALSKKAMEEAALDYSKKGLDVVVVRPFNHIGPGQLGGFLLPDLANQIIGADQISVGNLATKRDYTDVRDVVKAYVLLATKDNLSHNLYNVCSGASVSGQTILKLITSHLKKDDLKVNVDPDKIRPNDPMNVIGDNSRLRTETGWSPTIKLVDTIADYLDSISKS